jgi:ABC-2 type transport system permease protein
MGRYLRVLGVFYKAAILTELEYRANFLFSLLQAGLNVLWSVASVWVFFLHTDRIGDWVFHEALIILGLFQLFTGVIGMTIVPNVRDIVEHIRVGTMDFILTKPINSQFHASLRRIEVWRGIDVLLGAVIVGYGMSRLDVPPSLAQVGMFLVLCVAAFAILYALAMLLITSAFWVVRIDNIMEVLYGLFETGRFPISIFPMWLRVLLTAVVPIAFITTVPASVLTNRLTGEYVLYAFGMAGLLLALSVWFWNYAVRHYSSASS